MSFEGEKLIGKTIKETSHAEKYPMKSLLSQNVVE